MGPCHHGMARPAVADGGTASSMEGSCEYIEKADADSREGVVLYLLTLKMYHVTKIYKDLGPVLMRYNLSNGKVHMIEPV